MAKLIELRDVYKIYGEGLESEVRALDGVSLDIEKGEFVAVVGQWPVLSAWSPASSTSLCPQVEHWG